MVPSVTLPKATLLGLATRAPDVTPVPESGMLSGELEASEVTLIDPVTAPAVLGAKMALKVTV